MARIIAAQWTAPSRDASVSAGTCSIRTLTPLSPASTCGLARHRGGRIRGSRGQTGRESQGLVRAPVPPPGSLTNIWTTTTAGILTAPSGPGATPLIRRWSENSATSRAAVGPGVGAWEGTWAAWGGVACLGREEGRGVTPRRAQGNWTRPQPQPRSQLPPGLRPASVYQRVRGTAAP